MAKLVECVPNFSEGRDRGVIDAIAAALSSASGVKLLDVDPGADTNRTVYTLVGDPDGVVEAAFRGASKAAELIDMARHQGAHPRMGAMDVCPFVPVSEVSMGECVALAHRLGDRLGGELGVPVYFYEHAASSEQRRSLADVTAPLTVAVMGCPVNGPGEAKAADVGLAGGRGKAVIFSRGKILKTVPESSMIAALTEAVRDEVGRLKREKGRG